MVWCCPLSWGQMGNPSCCAWMQSPLKSLAELICPMASHMASMPALFLHSRCVEQACIYTSVYTFMCAIDRFARSFLFTIFDFKVCMNGVGVKAMCFSCILFLFDGCSMPSCDLMQACVDYCNDYSLPNLSDSHAGCYCILASYAFVLPAIRHFLLFKVVHRTAPLHHRFIGRPADL